MDWKATLEEILAERRQQLGESPSTLELIALRAGEVSDDERRRLLELAATDPEVAHELLGVLRFPETVDDDADRLADVDDREGVDERWQTLRDRMIAEGDLPTAAAAQPVASSKPHSGWLQLAAALAICVGAGLVGFSLRPPNTPVAQANPQIIELQAIAADAPVRRGAGERANLDPDTGGVVLTLDVLESLPEDGRYRLVILHGNNPVATVDDLAPGRGSLLTLTVPRASWREGLHELRLLDADGKTVARFQLEVELPP